MPEDPEIGKLDAIDIRPDGRGPDDFRSTKFEMNVVKNADGSCFYQQGNAKVICAVFGPLQRFKMRKLDDAAIVKSHMYRSRCANGDRPKHKSRADKEIHQIIDHVLNELILIENYPRTRIDVVFRVIESDGNNLAVCLNAVNFALMDAGINTRGILTVANCSYANETVIVDVCDQDEGISNIIVGSINGQQKATFVDLRGCFGRDIFKEILATALKACERLYTVFSIVSIQEVRRIHEADRQRSIEDVLEKLSIHGPQEKINLTPESFEDYDKAFDPDISDEDDVMDDDD